MAACDTRGIGGERLERAGRPAGSDQRNQIGRLELTIDEGVEGSPSVLQAFNRQPEVVDDERQRPLDVCALGGATGPVAASAMEPKSVPLAVSLRK